MHVARITLERVFDVVQDYHEGSARARTCFGFVSGSTKIYGAWLPGWVRVESGMRVVALLKKKDDLQTLFAWVDVDTKEIAGEDPLGNLLLSGLLLLVAVLFWMKAGDMFLPWAISLAAMGGGALLFLGRGVRAIFVRRTLRKLIA